MNCSLNNYFKNVFDVTEF